MPCLCVLQPEHVICNARSLHVNRLLLNWLHAPPPPTRPRPTCRWSYYLMFLPRTTVFCCETSVSDTEAFLLQGIRWRKLDLSFCPDRMSSWKGLTQVSVYFALPNQTVFERIGGSGACEFLCLCVCGGVRRRVTMRVSAVVGRNIFPKFDFLFF